MYIRGGILPGGVVLAGAVACSANGTTIIDTIGDWGAATTAVWDHVGQEFAAPVDDNVLDTFEIGVGGQAGTYSFSIYQWDAVGGQTVGGAVFATPAGQTIHLLPIDDPSLPSAPDGDGSTVRQTVWGVDTADDLEALGAELSKDRDVTRAADGTLSTVDESGFAIIAAYVGVVVRRPLKFPG